MRHKTLTTLAAASALFLPAMAHALIFTTQTLDFDDVPTGTDVSSVYAATHHVSFLGQYGPEVWTTDTTPWPNYTPLGVPSSPNALDGSQGSITMLFDGSFIPDGIESLSFDVVSDPDLYPAGSPAWDVPVYFLDANDQILSTVWFDQSASQTFSYSLSGVHKVVLPADSYYDNLRFSGQMVPEPGAFTTLLFGVSALAMFRKRRA